jgi:hypothetical protein
MGISRRNFLSVTGAADTESALAQSTTAKAAEPRQTDDD